MRLHQEGIPFILIASIVCIAGGVLAYNYAGTVLWKVIFITLFVALAGIMFFFFRDPDRNVTKDAHLVVAPSDGKVIEVDKVYVEEYFGCECTRISIFLSLFNVHVTWFPTGGEVSYFKYYPGAHTFAFLPKSSDKNEHSSVVVKDENGREVMFRQIAGIVARRVVCYAKEGKHFDQGAEAGFIKFGSRLTILIPGDVEPLVKVGDKVIGSVTLLARI